MEMPKPDFTTFVMSMASAVLVELGIIADPGSGKKRVNLDHARSHIDIIEMIEKKTKGNLTNDESVLIQKMITDLKMQYALCLKDKEAQK